MTAKQPTVKKYIVTLGADERERLNALIQKGKAPVRQVLKADASEAGEAWSDGQIAEALDTSLDTIARTRQQLVEGGIDAALTRKQSPNSARKRIFDGAAEAKLIALACSAPPKGRKRWTLTLLETAVVELNIVDRVSCPRFLWTRHCREKREQLTRSLRDQRWGDDNALMTNPGDLPMQPVAGRSRSVQLHSKSGASGNVLPACSPSAQPPPAHCRCHRGSAPPPGDRTRQGPRKSCTSRYPDRQKLRYPGPRLVVAMCEALRWPVQRNPRSSHAAGTSHLLGHEHTV